MRKFLYKAKNSSGQVVTGTVNAGSEGEAQKILSDHNFVVLDISLAKGKSIASYFGSKIKAKDRALFARQLATMLSAGLELPKAIKVTATQAKSDKIRAVYLDVYRKIEEGDSFSGALARHPSSFDKVFVSIIAAGEATGKLDTVLTQLAEQLENDTNFVGKIRGAMYYPALVLSALVVIGGYLMVSVIPQLKGLFESAGAQLPIATRVLMTISDFMVTKWWVVLIILAALIVFFRYYLKSDMGRSLKDSLQLKTPGLKTLFEGMYMYRFTRIMSMLVGAGVPLLDALKIGGSTIQNTIYSKSIEKMINQVEKGIPLSTQMAKDPMFPPLVGQMAAVGEETGQLDKVLSKVSDYYEESTNQFIKTISTLVEPIILIIIGCAVGFIVFAVMVPIYQISQVVS